MVERNFRPDANGAAGECNYRPKTNSATGGRNSRRGQTVRAGAESETGGLGRSRRRFIARVAVKSFGCHVFFPDVISVERLAKIKGAGRNLIPDIIKSAPRAMERRNVAQEQVAQHWQPGGPAAEMLNTLDLHPLLSAVAALPQLCFPAPISGTIWFASPTQQAHTQEDSAREGPDLSSPLRHRFFPRVKRLSRPLSVPAAVELPCGHLTLCLRLIGRGRDCSSRRLGSRLPRACPKRCLKSRRWSA